MKLNNKLLESDSQTDVQEDHIVGDVQYFISAEQNQDNSAFDEPEVAQANFGSLKETGPYVTSYVSLVVPRFKKHLLMGDLSDQLHIWMKDICISFGWQLQITDIRTDYLHWIMAVSITEYPTQFMTTFYRESSQKIFTEFPRLSHKNMSNEFWAPLYVVNVGQVPYAQDAIQSYIQQIRTQQGIQ